MPPGQPTDYPSSFWRDFRDCNVGMYITNNSLVPDPEAEPGILTSRPIQWLFMQAGIRMSSWAEQATRFYMLGNPLVWWFGSVSVILNLCLVVYYFLMDKRNGGRHKNYSQRVQHYFRSRDEEYLLSSQDRGRSVGIQLPTILLHGKGDLCAPLLSCTGDVHPEHRCSCGPLAGFGEPRKKV